MYGKLHRLLKAIETAEKRGGLLLLDNLTQETIAHLQSLTDDNVIVIFTHDGSRIEIKKNNETVRRRGIK